MNLLGRARDTAYRDKEYGVTKLGAMRINHSALRVVRELSGLSQAELSRISGLSQGYISEIESGQKAPRPDTVHRLAKSIGVPVASIIRD